MLEEFLHPADYSLFIPDKYTLHQLGPHVVQGLDISEAPLAIIGVCEDRRSINNMGSAEGPDQVRHHLFKLSKHLESLKIVDLGNIEQGATVRDTYVALSKVVNELIRMRVVPVIIGGSHDLTFGQFGAYHDLGRNINVAIVDSTIDIRDEQHEINDSNFLVNLLMHEPSNIFNLNVIGYQTHLTSLHALDLMEKLHFESNRLGKVQADISDVEPILRSTNLFSMDMAAIRFADAPGTGDASPNGLYGEEACQLAMYAGTSDTVDSFGLYGCNPLMDVRDQTAQLAAQIIWYFLDGFSNRKGDHPQEKSTDYTKYSVHIKENDYDLNFWKSRKSDRWWMEVPTGNQPRNRKKFHMVPCSYNDYLVATREELPERWIKTYQKLS